MGRRWLAPEDAAELGRLDPEAIARVREEAWPDAANRDELHDGLAWLGFLTEAEAAAGAGWRDGWRNWRREARDATRLVIPAKAGTHRQPSASRRRGSRPAPGVTAESGLWIAAERLPQFLALWPDARLDPPIAAPAPQAERSWSADEALVEILRGRLEGLGPVAETALAAPLGLAPDAIAAALAALQERRVSRCAAASRPDAADGRMVRAPAAGAHPPLHAEAAARRDRAGRGARLPALPVRLAAGHRRDPHGRAGRARRGARPARRVRGAGRRLGDRDPAGARRRIRAGLARRPVPRRPHRLGPAAAAQRRGPERRARPERLAGPVRTTPITLAGAPARAAVDRAVADARSGAGQPARAGRRRLHPRPRRLVLRRAGRRHEAVAAAGRGGAGRAGGAGAGQLGQLRRAARAADAGRQAPLAAAAAALFGMEDAGRWALARRARPRARPPTAGRRGRRAPRAHAAAPLRRRVLARCSNARPPGCRRGATCCASTAGSKRAAKSAAAASSPAFPASSSRCPRRSACCARSGASRAPANSCRCPAPIR